MAIIKSKEDLENLKHSCRILMSCFHHLEKLVAANVDCGVLDDFAHKFIASYDAVPSFYKYGQGHNGNSFQYALCISINEEVVHGIANSGKILPDNSIVKLDMGVNYKGMFSDSAKTVVIGKISDKAQQMIKVNQECLMEGIKIVKAGIKTGDIGHTIDSYVKKYGFGNVYDLGGHGVGYAVHEPPFIPHQGKANQGSRLFENQAICIEPMLTLGTSEVVFDQTKQDGWTVRTKDNSLASHFEHTLLVTKKGHEILTQIDESNILPIKH
jgi:methionyl aminopeptidase